MPKEIVISVTPAGSTTVDAQGFQGCGCEEATEQIELVLGGGVVKKERKPEYYAPASTNQSQKLTF